MDLLSPDCPIRYIITVNALKEGWDCPFAYVLATVANRTSTVDVEQILGRVLRLPYTQKNSSEVLNLSYVITSSADFHQTLEKVVAGLNSAGFSSHDYRAQDVDVPVMAPPTAETEQLPIVTPPADEPDLPEVDGSDLKARFEAATQEAEQSVQDGTMQSDPMLSQALQQNKTYEDEINQADNTALSQAPSEVRDKMNQFRMNEEFADEAAALGKGALQGVCQYPLQPDNGYHPPPHRMPHPSHGRISDPGKRGGQALYGTAAGNAAFIEPEALF